MKKNKFKKKSVWLINQYLCSPELNGDGHRHSYLADEFIKKGYDVTLITSSFSHVPYRENKFKGFYKVIDGDIRTLLIKGNVYKQTQGVSRIMSWLIFCFLLFFIPKKNISRPDIIIVSSNSLLPILNVVFYFKKKFRDVKFVLEIRDIWPLSLIEIGNYSYKNPFVQFLSWVEKLGYKNADHIVSLLMDTDKHIEKVLKSKEFNYTWISNGYQLENDNYYEKITKSLKDKIPKDTFIIGYAGSLGRANAMEYVIDVVRDLKNDNIALCILGDGDEKENLVKRASGSNKIVFFDRLPKNKVMSFLKECDLLYFSSKDLSIYKYGISANKTFDYMYAEKPILLSAPTENNVVELCGCGIVIPAENKIELKKDIISFSKMSILDRSEMGRKGKQYLLDYFTYEKLAQKYIQIFNSL